jgi:hypothetical protein
LPASVPEPGPIYINHGHGEHGFGAIGLWINVLLDLSSKVFFLTTLSTSFASPWVLYPRQAVPMTNQRGCHQASPNHRRVSVVGMHHLPIRMPEFPTLAVRSWSL